ncbi:MAG: sodium ion-translocating decarboxylase subunit beta [Eubacteriales bacterium]
MKRLIIGLITILSLLVGCASEKATSIAIIGGADGPTSVFVAGKVRGYGTIGVIIIIVLVIVTIIYFIKKR